MKRIQQQPSRQICRRIAATLFEFAAILLPFAARAASLCSIWAIEQATLSGTVSLQSAKPPPITCV